MPLCGLPSLAGGEHANGYGGANGKAPARPLSRKVVVVGDGACGKTSMLNVYVRGEFPQEYEPTVFENHVAEVDVDGTRIELALWDTAGQEDFDRLRVLSYTDVDVVLLCFSVDQPTSLENVEAKWIEEIHQHCPGVKVALVALKCDLRADPVLRDRLAQYGEVPVEYEQGLDVARRIRASRYLECSALHNRGVQEAFDETARVAMTARRAGETRGSQGGPGAGGGGGANGCRVM